MVYLETFLLPTDAHNVKKTQSYQNILKLRSNMFRFT